MPLRSSRFAGDPILEDCLKGKRTLGLGSSGNSVKRIQSALIDMQLLKSPTGADGKFGLRTKEAVIAFQVNGVIDPTTGIVVNGIIDQPTIARMDSIMVLGVGGDGSGILKPPGTHWGVDTAGPANGVVPV